MRTIGLLVAAMAASHCAASQVTQADISMWSEYASKQEDLPAYKRKCAFGEIKERFKLDDGELDPNGNPRWRTLRTARAHVVLPDDNTVLGQYPGVTNWVNSLKSGEYDMNDMRIERKEGIAPELRIHQVKHQECYIPSVVQDYFRYYREDENNKNILPIGDMTSE